ncbi:MAG: glutamate racemase [Oligoflexia bacterium]|nr:glutamate racemase [Oligoflexia bacterium]
MNSKDLGPLSHTEAAIGVFDSGLGGLTVLKELKLRLPQERYIYLGDTARTPYGSKGRETIIRFARECSEFLFDWGIKMLVVACNTASSYAIEALRAESPIPILGTIDAAARQALQVTRTGKIGVIGTDATIASRAFEKALQRDGFKHALHSKACPLFVPLVEQGMCEGEIVEKIVELYLSDFRRADLDTLILGCTHYPLLKNVIQEFLGAEVRIVECSAALAEEAGSLLPEYVLSKTSPLKKDRLFITDDTPKFESMAAFILGSSKLSVERAMLGEGARP